MQFLLAAGEGQVQDIHLGSTEWIIVISVLGVAVLALALGGFLMKSILAEDQGSVKMREIAQAIQEGALAYLKRQFKTITVMVVILFGLVFLTAIGDGTMDALSRSLAFVAGCVLSALTGFIGMSLAVRGNVRTTAASQRSLLRRCALHLGPAESPVSLPSDSACSEQASSL